MIDTRELGSECLDCVFAELAVLLFGGDIGVV